MAKTLYFNIEDDVKSVVARLRMETGNDFVLVFPRRCYLFSDPVNLKLLKKQLDVLHKTAAIMTMDERGQQAAEEAGFELKVVPTRQARTGMSDVATPRNRQTTIPVRQAASVAEPEPAAEEVPVAVAPIKRPTVQRPVVRPIPAVAVHDTIFSDIPKRPSLQGAELQARYAGKRRRRTAWLGAVALIVVAALLLGVFVLPKAQVVVYAKAENITRDLEIGLATTTKDADVNTLSLPAYAVDKTVELSDKFQATGKKEVGSKAQGKVRIFNLTGASINLRVATTTLSAQSRTFAFVSDQNYIPALSQKNASSPTAGRVADVVAVEGGELSNLPAGTRLEITNQVFGNKPQVLYAVVDEDLTGGNSRFVTTVEEADLAKAQTDLTTAIVTQLTSSLKAESRYLAERAFEAQVIEFIADKPAGAESPTFTAQIKIRIQGLAFDPVALTNLVRSRVAQVLPTGTTLQPAEKDLMSFRVRELSVPEGKVRLIVHLESRLYKDVDVLPLRSTIAGKSKQEAENELLQKPNVGKVEIILSPSWQKNLPRVVGRIELVEKQE